MQSRLLCIRNSEYLRVPEYSNDASIRAALMVSCPNELKGDFWQKNSHVIGVRVGVNVEFIGFFVIERVKCR